MARKRHKEEDILRILREIEINLNSGADVASACRHAGISDKTYYVWRKKYGGMNRARLAEMKNLEKENQRLKRQESVINQIMRDWTGNIEALRPALKFKNKTMDDPPFFTIVDAFRLRPEFVFPMFFNEDIRVLPNWEYKGLMTHKLHFRNFQDAEEQLSSEMTRWAEPGLAGALLSAKYWFENEG